MTRKAPITVLALAAALLLAGLPTPAGDGPCIDVPNPEIDAGIISRGESLSAVYTLRNTGTESLRLISVDGHCPCIETALSHTEIPPGGEGALDVRFTAASGAGDTVRIIELTTNDPERRTISLTFKARVAVPFGFADRAVDMGRVHHEYAEPLIREAILLIRESSTAKPAALETSSPLVTARLTGNETVAQGQRRLGLEVSLLPGLPPGPVAETVTVRSAGEGLEPAVLEVNGLVTGDVAAAPEQLRLLVVETARRTARDSWARVYLTGHSPDRPLTILTTRDSNGILDLDLAELIPGQKYELTVTLGAEALDVNSQITGTVEITTNSPSQPVVSVGYSAARRRYDKLDQDGEEDAAPATEAPPEAMPAEETKEPARG